MGQTRTKRKLIHDRIDRNLWCHKESIRRLEEIMGFYMEGEETSPGRYTQLIAMVAEILRVEIAVLALYETFHNVANP